MMAGPTSISYAAPTNALSPDAPFGMTAGSTSISYASSSSALSSHTPLGMTAGSTSYSSAASASALSSHAPYGDPRQPHFYSPSPFPAANAAYLLTDRQATSRASCCSLIQRVACMAVLAFVTYASFQTGYATAAYNFCASALSSGYALAAAHPYISVGALVALLAYQSVRECLRTA